MTKKAKALAAPSPSVPRLKPIAGSPDKVAPDHDDYATWAALTCVAMGTPHADFALLLTNQAVNAGLRGGPTTKIDLDVANGVMAAIAGIGPRDEIEAMLAVQMAATHVAAVEMLKRAMLNQPTLQISDSLANRATKLLRTYTAQVETLSRYRNAGKQQVIVQHQHIGIAADKAVVGINAPGMAGGGVPPEMEEQPHGQA